MLRSLTALVMAVLVWTGGQRGSARQSDTPSEDRGDVLVLSEVTLPGLPDVGNDRSDTSRSRPRRHALPPEPPHEPLPLPDGLQSPLDSPDSDQEASLATLRRFSPRRTDFSVCCPAGEELTSPQAGTKRDGSLGILYADDQFQQMFFERSCQRRTDGEDAVADRRLRRRFRCVQQYSHSYAVYKENGTKVLDYIKIRSGCRCEMKKRGKRKRKKT